MTEHTVTTRFRGFLPVVIDVETAGFNAATDALLEVAAVLIEYRDGVGWCRRQTIAHHVAPFAGANLDQRSLDFNKIDPFHPFRLAVSEEVALEAVFSAVREQVHEYSCTRAILVGHNPAFDLAFMKAASARVRIKQFPFHNFSTFDTAALSGVAFGQTVLARAVRAAGFAWDANAAHSAIYDAERTADLFCEIVNRWDRYSAAER
jgi:ribonuclease T